MLTDMTSEQFIGWYQYYLVEQFGYHIDNLRHNVKETYSTNQQTPQSTKPNSWEDNLAMAKLIMATYR